MDSRFQRFALIARRAGQFTEARSEAYGGDHPFDLRNIHAALPGEVRALFDNGHYAQSTFEAFKFIDKEVERHAAICESGESLMMKAFSETSPLVQLTKMTTESEKNEQEGFKFLFAGAIVAIRNPRGHEYSIKDSPETCLDHLALASVLLRRLEAAGFKCGAA